MSGLHVLVIGAGGMLGRKLVARLARDGGLNGKPIARLSLVDVVAPTAPDGLTGTVDCTAADLSAPGEAERMVADKPDVVFHLAAIVSGEAEADFERGYRINLDGTRYLFEAVRAQAYMPRVVFTSSVAVFGAPLPDRIPDDLALTPLTSYGTQKAIGELLLADYSRRGFMDGIGLRLPTICIRPGAPNRAASGFFSNILREPLVGKEAVLPVPETVRHWHASPRAAIQFLVHAAGLDTAPMGQRRTLSLPGPVRHRRRADRGASSRGRGGRRPADPARARRGHRPHRRRLAPRLRPGSRPRARVQGGKQLRRDHPGPHRGRAGRTGLIRRFYL